MDEVLPTLVPHVGPDTLVLSIAAGRTIESLAKHLPAGTAIVRAIFVLTAILGTAIGVPGAMALAYYGVSDPSPSDALDRAVLRLLASQHEPALRRRRHLCRT